ncbi:hypothetical protein SALBM311S_01119 [Streptomyces alboniger]
MSERKPARMPPVTSRPSSRPPTLSSPAARARKASPWPTSRLRPTSAKARFFRAFGNHPGLLRALYKARLEPVREAVEAEPQPLGPATPPQQRVPALLDALLCFKLDNRRLVLALEASGSGGSPYQADHYERWHGLLDTMLGQIPGLTDSDFTAHALLAATRADLVEYLAGQECVPRERMRAQLANFTARVLNSGPVPGLAGEG